MKLGNIAGAVLAMTTLGVSLAVATPDTSAQAKAKVNSIKTFPKAMRGNWYRYGEHNGFYYKRIKISAKKFVAHNALDPTGTSDKLQTFTQSLHVLKAKKSPKYSKKAQSWCYAYTKKKVTTIHQWVNVDQFQDPIRYKVTHKTYNGKKVKVLTVVSTSYNNHTDHYYQTKAQAKHFNPAGALHN
ncbi:hypothetical protein [Levilactobacillus suantsaii]|uniref:Surface layer protein A domain-containing protein n=1 Tax=Levilactobacillus suantsaii TaxID=2292255 RepID=A0A4Q0VF40_9LACO|nr:hypothetical protein [Levilactobacillus suantsaii]QMU08464.1 hypothetical protein H3M12_01965 [Levilactobacillus suantsaii]RXI75928.1 hypothetical protein DXH47_11260 [Levilactobacillus suantsaii]